MSMRRTLVFAGYAGSRDLVELLEKPHRSFYGFSRASMESMAFTAVCACVSL